MALKIKIIFFLLSIFVFTDTFGQTITKNDVAGKWNSNLQIDSVKPGDTIVFTKDGKYKNFYLKSNQKLEEPAFYMYCGKKYFKDYFSPKPPYWIAVGSWDLSTVDQKTLLTMTIDSSKVLTFVFVSHDKNKLVLYSNNEKNIYYFFQK